MKYNNFGLKMVHMLKMIFFFLEKPLIWDSCNSWLVLLYRISKKPLEWIQSYDDAAFWAQNGVFSSNENFFRKTINIVSMYILATLSVQNFKNGSFAQKENIFRKHVSKPCCVHLCSSTCKKLESGVTQFIRYC